MAFEKFTVVRNQRGTSMGTIDKTGRLLLPQSIVEAGRLAHDQHVEIYWDREARSIGLMPVAEETVHSVRIRRNGKARDDGKPDSLVVSVQTLLGEYRIMVPKRVRGRMVILPDGMITFAFETVAAMALPANGAMTQAQEVPYS